MKYVPFFGCMISVKYPQMEAAVRKTASNLGMDLVDLEGFSWLTVAARNICIAEEAGLDLITMCSGCTATLSEVNYHLKNEPELKEQVNKRLEKIGKKFQGSIRVRHIVTAVRDDLGLDVVKQSVKKPLKDIKVAIHYGCHLLKPSEIMQVDDPNHPSILENLFSAIGTQTISHEKQALCCGKACMSEAIPENMTYDVLSSIRNSGADCMGLICPTCFDEFDIGQIRLSQKRKEPFGIPIVYYFQMLGLAQGFSPKELGFHMHRSKTDNLLSKLA